MSCLKFIVSVIIVSFPFYAFSQKEDSSSVNSEILDSLFIVQVEDHAEPDKVLHAEPLYIDLIRDLGARKGEKEWNIGTGLTDNYRYDAYQTLVEYEFAPADRLGLEVELPFTFYYQNGNNDSIPQSKLNSLKLASQFTFFVSEKLKTSMAIGYIHEFELIPFNDYADGKLFKGQIFNPFFIVAKRFGDRFHGLIYSGPKYSKEVDQHLGIQSVEINSNFHYMIPGTRNFIGLEMNKQFTHKDFDMTLRPQMRVGITDKLLIGIVTGIPVNRENERLSTFLRFIYEPGHRLR